MFFRRKEGTILPLLLTEQPSKEGFMVYNISELTDL